MRFGTRILLVMLTLALGAGTVLAEGEPSAEEMQAMMKKFQELTTPGPQHAAMAKRVGSWTTAAKYWQTPGGEAGASQGTATVRMDMDGRYMIEETQSQLMGMAYRGFNIVAFDNLRQEYEMIYIDNMGTGIISATGKADADGKTVTMTGKMDDAMSGQKDMAMRYVVRDVDADHYVFEMYGPGPDGKEYKMMETTYTRVK